MAAPNDLGWHDHIISGEELGKLSPDGIFRIFEVCRNLIAAENTLVSSRLTWAITLSGGS